MIDAHCHLSDERIYDQADAIIKRALDAGITRIGLGGVEPDEWERQIVLKSKYPTLILTHFGIHPWWIERYSEAELQTMLTLLEEKVSLADGLGETGLDHGPKRKSESFDLQERLFRAQLKIAIQHQKPVILHIVYAHELAVQILNQHGGSDGKFPVPLILHRYSGSAEQMSAYLKLGAVFSFSGEFASQKGHLKTKEAFKHVPLKSLLIETDAPDQGAEPASINEFYRAGAYLRGIAPEKLKETVAENFSRIY